MSFKSAFESTVGIEGGYSNNPNVKKRGESFELNDARAYAHHRRVASHSRVNGSSLHIAARVLSASLVRHLTQSQIHSSVYCWIGQSGSPNGNFRVRNVRSHRFDPGYAPADTTQYQLEIRRNSLSSARTSECLVRHRVGTSHLKPCDISISRGSMNDIPASDFCHAIS